MKTVKQWKAEFMADRIPARKAKRLAVAFHGLETATERLGWLWQQTKSHEINNWVWWNPKKEESTT